MPAPDAQSPGVGNLQRYRILIHFERFAGNWVRRPLELDEYEVMALARKPR